MIGETNVKLSSPLSYQQHRRVKYMNMTVCYSMSHEVHLLTSITADIKSR